MFLIIRLLQIISRNPASYKVIGKWETEELALKWKRLLEAAFSHSSALGLGSSILTRLADLDESKNRPWRYQ